MTPAQWALAEYMSDISEDNYCAGWLIDLEHTLWDAVMAGPSRFGMGDITAENIAELRRLSNDAGGWIVYVSGKGETFVPMAEWLEIHSGARTPQGDDR
jgi:hypothetical protein